MSRTVWFNCCAGVAGDMLLASLIDAGADRLAIMAAWGALDVDGYAATWEEVQRCGVRSLWTNIAVDDPGRHEHDGHDHAGHGHGHHHDGHPHRPASEVVRLISEADLPPTVRDNAVAVYRRLAEVEGSIHGTDPDDVELHEVGALDSILDVVGVCAALDDLGLDEITYSAVAVGHGTVHTAHGELPNPVPAVSYLLADAGVTTVGVDTTMELSTPTGVALLTTLGRHSLAMPSMVMDSTGFGAGTADPPGRPNVVQAVVGTATTSDHTGRPCRLVEVNVDDATGEVVAHTVAALLAAGAFDAWATPIVMKKGRPAHTISALCDDAHFEQVRSVLVRESGSLGVRAGTVERWPQGRSEHTVDVDGHRVRVKVGDSRIKVEHDDALVVAEALGIPLREALARAEQAARRLADGQS